MKRFYIPDIDSKELDDVWKELCRRMSSVHGLTLLKRHVYALTFDHGDARHRAEVGGLLWSERVEAICQTLGPYLCFTESTFRAGTPLLISRESVVSVEFFGS